ncbi:MAG: hypothetical protein F6K47_05025 [Symploca sp. SIO2E6]|nr:hypothetical protein [Symploca sp. SIO2E6]
MISASWCRRRSLQKQTVWDIYYRYRRERQQLAAQLKSLAPEQLQNLGIAPELLE